MKRLQCCLFLAIICPSLAWGSLSQEPVTITSRQISPQLRSAFLLRTIGVPQEYRYADADGLRNQLQAHFDVVLDLLVANQERSLQVALRRLEQRQGVLWTSSQRAYWQRYLSNQRSQNLARLAAYRDRGMFPLNEGHAQEGAPIFVDNHDTACAVGHLMRESGWEREVELIAATNLLVYVTDVSTGPLVDWVLQSGLTLGEAALIQPFYAPPFADIPMDTLSGTGTGFYAPATFVNGMGERTIANGLRYENFSWRKLTNINVVPDINRTPPGFPFEIIEYGGISGIWQSETRNDIGMRTDYRYVVGGGGYPDYYVGPHANLLTLAPVNDFNDEVLHSIGTSLSAFALSFDVVANHPAVALERVGAYITNGFVMGRVETWSFVTHPSSSVQLVKFPYEMQGSPTVNHAPSDAILDSLYASVDYTGWASGTIGQHYDSTSLQSLKRVTVHAFMLVRDWEEGLPNSSLFGALTFDVGVVSLVPEPTTGVLALSMAAVGLLWRRSN